MKYLVSTLATYIIFGIFLLSGCVHYVPVTRIVHIHTTKYIPIPPSLLTPCPKADPAKLKTNGDLLKQYLDDQASLTGCNGQLEAIKTLAPPPASN